MNAAAVCVMKDLPDLIVAYGVSDEYRFVVSFFGDYFYVDKIV
jgi:tRNA(His) 5'-end guanylyltransferase